MKTTTTTLQTTGHPPVSVITINTYAAQDTLDRRTVMLGVYVDEPGNYWYQLALHTDWVDERISTYIGGPFINDKDHIELMVAAIHFDAALILPPGAGYPATPEFDARQSKLKGQLYWLALSCLSRVLSMIHQEQGQTP